MLPRSGGSGGASSNHRLPAFLEGTPGMYLKRASPPRVPSAVTLTHAPITSSVSHGLPLRRKSTTPRSRFSSQSSCASTSGAAVSSTLQQPVSLGSQQQQQQQQPMTSEVPAEQPQRQSAARRPVTRQGHQPTHHGHPVTGGLSSHSFHDASKNRLETSLRNSHSIGNLGFYEKYSVKPHLAMSFQNVAGSGEGSGLAKEPAEVKRNVSSSLQSLPSRFPGSSILNENASASLPEEDLPLPPNWAVETTADNFRYYVDHNNRRTHWIHPLASENLPPGWTKIFDESYGVVFYNEHEQRSQFEHPGLATPASNIAQVHGSFQSIAPQRQHEAVEDLNIISEEIPLWLQMYSEAPSDSDHLLDFKLFKLHQLETFDLMLLKLFKQDTINTVIKHERPRREINKELMRRLYEESQAMH
uniref:WW domain-containing protein n=1 Tax=Panagrellus redivivus TaxID=6233 RepID=A0A7E4V8P0_PANRE